MATVKASVKAAKSKSSKRIAKSELSVPFDGENSKSDAVLSEFEGNRGRQVTVLNLEPEKDRYGTSFGLRKAALILEHLDQVRKFVESDGTEC